MIKWEGTSDRERELEAELSRLREENAGLAKRQMILVRQAAQAVQDWHEQNDITVEEALDMVEERMLALSEQGSDLRAIADELDNRNGG